MGLVKNEIHFIVCINKFLNNISNCKQFNTIPEHRNNNKHGNGEMSTQTQTLDEYYYLDWLSNQNLNPSW